MPAQNYVLLERIELNTSAASVTFSNIPGTGYTDLKVVVSGRSTASAANDNLWMKFNGDNASYSERVLYGSGSAAASANSSGNADSRYLAPIPGATSTSSTFGNSEIYIPNYTLSSNKSVSLDGVAENNATAAYSQIQAILWSNTAAITSIQFGLITGSYVQYSTFSLYGLAALGTTPTIAPKASGGDVIDYDGTYWIHTFNTTGAFVPAVGLTCDYLVIAGGGGGSVFAGGGGGAGGYKYATSQSLSTTSYTVTVGAGGAGGVPNTVGSNGSSSVFNADTMTGGGAGGGGNFTQNGSAGSSGGGASGSGGNSTSTGGSATSGQGSAGGNGVSTSSDASGGGGGGGSTSAGSNGVTVENGGNGGSSTSNSITGTSIARAGGGGGSGGNGMSAGTGGGGGAGAGGVGVGANGTSATINTGSGGGVYWVTGNGGNGGSGIVIIRYLAA